MIFSKLSEIFLVNFFIEPLRRATSGYSNFLLSNQFPLDQEFSFVLLNVFYCRIQYQYFLLLWKTWFFQINFRLLIDYFSILNSKFLKVGNNVGISFKCIFEVRYLYSKSYIWILAYSYHQNRNLVSALINLKLWNCKAVVLFLFVWQSKSCVWPKLAKAFLFLNL